MTDPQVLNHRRFARKLLARTAAVHQYRRVVMWVPVWFMRGRGVWV